MYTAFAIESSSIDTVSPSEYLTAKYHNWPADVEVEPELAVLAAARKVDIRYGAYLDCKLQHARDQKISALLNAVLAYVTDRNPRT